MRGKIALMIVLVIFLFSLLSYNNMHTAMSAEDFREFAALLVLALAFTTVVIIP
jgi:cell division protein FtsW (lipid II flippase)